MHRASTAFGTLPQGANRVAAHNESLLGSPGVLPVTQALRTESRRFPHLKQRRLCVSVPSSVPQPSSAAVGADYKESSARVPDTPGSAVEQCILVGDIGGTNARLSVAQIGPDQAIIPKFRKSYKTKDYNTFLDVLIDLANQDAVKACPPTAACFAVAGPVKNGKGQMTNLSWAIDGDQVEKQFGWRAAVINDFEAQGYGVLEINQSETYIVNDGDTELEAPKVVIGPGTGLGEAQLMWDEGLQDYKVWPSEGSHADFAPRGDTQAALMEWVVDGLGSCEVEHVACGSGLERIYAFLTSPKDFTAAGDFPKKAEDISKEALDGSNVVAMEAVDMMLSIVGSEAGHMALRSLARGGVYITGGIPPKLLDRIKTGVMQEAFLHEGCRFHHLLSQFRVSVVLNKDLGLLGVRRYAMNLLNRN